MRTILAALAVVFIAAPASAQYYVERPPPPRGYYPARPEYRPGYARRFGGRCDAIIRTQYGREHMICPIVEPKPLGRPCACPAPRRAGYGPRAFIPGRTIR